MYISYVHTLIILLYSLFAGMTVIANFFLMITWLPACVILSEHCKLTTLSPVNFITRKIIRPLRSLGNKVTVGFTIFLTEIVIRLRFLWLLSLGIMAIACCIIVFHHPGLELPDYIDFQLFHNTHPFEQYDLIYSRKFWFERHEMVLIYLYLFKVYIFTYTKCIHTCNIYI